MVQHSLLLYKAVLLPCSDAEVPAMLRCIQFTDRNAPPSCIFLLFCNFALCISVVSHSKYKCVSTLCISRKYSIQILVCHDVVHYVT